MKIFLFALLFMCEVAGARNIVLLTSLPPKDQRLAAKAERIFYKKTLDFAEDYQVLVKHNADQEVLFKYLNDPETHALFWMSHGGYIKAQPGAGVRPAPMLLDYQYDNVAKVFQKIHPNIKYVGIIGCNSQQILENVLKERDDLDTYVPNKKVIAQFALRYSIKNFRYTRYRKDNSRLVKVSPEGHSVIVTRKTSELGSYKSLKVFVGGELLTVLPKMAANSIQEFKLTIPHKDHYLKKHLKIVFDNGRNPMVNSNTIGELSLAYEGQNLWKLFSKPDGEPFGINERIFIYTGDRFGE